MNPNQISQIQSVITASDKLAVLVSQGNFDLLSAGVSLALSLEKSGKEVTIFSPQVDSNLAAEIVGLEKVVNELEKKDLAISFDYPLDQIDKVSSHEEAGRLNLVVKVKPESAAITPDQVKITSPQLLPKAGFVLGSEQLIPNNNQLLTQGTWVWLGTELAEKSWAKGSYIIPRASYSELVARMIQSMGLPMDPGIARNLYGGIKVATNSFETVRDYRTLEVAAVCFKVFQSREISEQPVIETPPIEEVEKKEGGFPTPKIFKGATTPRV